MGDDGSEECGGRRKKRGDFIEIKKEGAKERGVVCQIIEIEGKFKVVHDHQSASSFHLETVGHC